MKVKSEFDLMFQLIVGTTVILMIAPIGLIPQQERWVMYILVIPTFVFLGWIVLDTWYELRDEYLYCVSVPFREKIYYDKIKNVKLSENMLSSMALSRKRIEIRQHNKNYITGTTLISPRNREDFFVQLKRRCNNLEK
jgi:hypothetical protein